MSSSDMECESEINMREDDIRQEDEEISSASTLIVSRVRKHCVTPRLANILDRCKISDRDTVHLLAAAEVFCLV